MAKKSIFKRALKRLSVLALGIMLSLSAVACDGASLSAAEVGGSDPDVHVWTLRSTERALLQKYDKTVTVANKNEKVDYSALYGNTTLYINAFQNEYEFGQIVLTPTVDIESYDVTITDLTSGENTLSKDCFTLYNAKYMGVLTKEGNQGAGYYPDAMLYLDKAVEYGENHVEKGNNQTIYVMLHPDGNQPAGIYTGSFTVTADDNTYNVPVEVEIYDCYLSDAPRVKYNVGAGAADTAAGELDTTKEMQEAYYDFFTSYRCFSGMVPTFSRSVYWSKANIFNSDGSWAPLISEMAELTRKYAKQDTCNAYYLPYQTNAVPISYIDKYTGDDKLTTASMVDASYYIYFIRCLVEKSFNNYDPEGGNTDLDVDLLAKAETYFVYFDEFDSTSGKDLTAVSSLKLVQYLQYRIKQMYIQKWAGGDPNQLTEQEKQVLDSVMKIKHHCIGQKTALFSGGNDYIVSIDFTIAADALDMPAGEKITLNLLDRETPQTDKYGYPLYTPMTQCSFITTLNNYDSALNRKVYEDYANSCKDIGGELWVYTAENHNYASLHMEVPLLSERLQGWMMADFNVIGNLYWSGGLMRKYVRTSGQYIDFLQDYFDTPERYIGTNGEGFIIYPGRQYGVYGPLPSVRLCALRDGLEEADLWYYLRDYYEERANDWGEEFKLNGFRNILHLVSPDLYSGSHLVDTNVMDSSIFQKARKMLAELLVLAGNTGAVIEDFDYASGILSAKISAPNGVEIKVGNTALNPVKTENGYTLFEYNISLGEVGETVTFTAIKEGKSYSATLPSQQLAKTVDSGDCAISILPTAVSKQVVNAGRVLDAVETGDGTNGTLQGEKIAGVKFENYEAITGFDSTATTALKAKGITISGFTFDGLTNKISFSVKAPTTYTITFAGEELEDGTVSGTGANAKTTYNVEYDRDINDPLPILTATDGTNNLTAELTDKASGQNQAINVDLTNEGITGEYIAVSVRIYVDKAITVKLAGVNKSGVVTPCAETFDLTEGWNEIHVNMSELGVATSSAVMKGIRVLSTSITDATLKTGRIYFLK